MNADEPMLRQDGDIGVRAVINVDVDARTAARLLRTMAVEVESGLLEHLRDARIREWRPAS